MNMLEACTDCEGLRIWVNNHCQIAETTQGNLWLPIVLTARGPLYAEAIGQRADGTYYQPHPLSDRVKQPLYHLGFRLLTHLEATPAVYLLQFTLNDWGTVLFDRLLPFPDRPAQASQGVQEPDLFTCHWLCIEKQPIFDLVIRQ